VPLKVATPPLLKTVSTQVNEPPRGTVLVKPWLLARWRSGRATTVTVSEQALSVSSASATWVSGSTAQVPGVRGLTSEPGIVGVTCSRTVKLPPVPRTTLPPLAVHERSLPVIVQTGAPDPLTLVTPLRMGVAL
jgi:hypothetical protein